jgi:hypothetical protein
MNFKLLLTYSFIVTSAIASAQNTNKAFAITGDGNQDFVWMNIRQVDLGTGQVSKTIFERSKSNFVLTDVQTKTSSTQASAIQGNLFQSKDYPTGSLVAAAAYDQRNHQLFFTPMRIGELRWLDLDFKNETPHFYTLSSAVLNFGDAMDEANHITRMVIAADGNGYAITNDGNHFIKFTTGRKPVITDLGNLIDDEKNGGLSIHSKCSSWGGDMLADAFGKLYVISANRNVFVVDINSRVASFKGSISGLPANYTTNAAAVNADGDIVVSSANIFEGYYKVTLVDLKATPIEGSDRRYNASDLANSNLLLQKEADANQKYAVTASLLPQNTFSHSDKRIFPNPVTDGRFTILFDGEKAGNYSITIQDISGRIVQSQQVNIGKAASQNLPIHLVGRPSKGMYLVKAYDEAQQLVFAEKILIQ